MVELGPAPQHDLARRLAAEGVGSALLLATIVGSGAMAERLAGGNAALALLGNTLPTAAMLFVLILIFAPISGAHFNPIVSAVFAARRELPYARVPWYWLAQVGGAVAGAAIAHAMFARPLLSVSAIERAGGAIWLSESVATFGLVVTILGTLGRPTAITAAAVGLYIGAAYWFTASTSFANPAVTIARALTDTFTGIAPAGVPAFVAAQVVGGVAAALFFSWLWQSTPARQSGRIV
jgi:glycerol uptake facilitator-like aquaporin